MRERVATTFRDFIQCRVRPHFLARVTRLVLRAQWRVCLWQNAVREAEFNKLRVRQEGMGLDLVDGRLDLGNSKQFFQARNRPVRNASCSRLPSGIQLLHRAPCRLWVLRQAFLDNVLAVGAGLRHVLLILLGSNGLVQKEQVNVVHLKLLERVFQRPPHLVGLVQVVPHFRGDGKVGSLHAWVLGEEVPHCPANLVFILVEPGAVEVTVTCL